MLWKYINFLKLMVRDENNKLIRGVKRTEQYISLSSQYRSSHWWSPSNEIFLFIYKPPNESLDQPGDGDNARCLAQIISSSSHARRFHATPSNVFPPSRDCGSTRLINRFHAGTTGWSGRATTAESRRCAPRGRFNPCMACKLQPPTLWWAQAPQPIAADRTFRRDSRATSLIKLPALKFSSKLPALKFSSRKKVTTSMSAHHKADDWFPGARSIP